MNKSSLSSFLSVVICGFAAHDIRAATFSANFNDGAVPPNSAVFGNAVVELTGGVNDSGVLKLTKNINSQQGSIVINDLDAGAAVSGFTAALKVRVGGGTSTPADGFSFCWATDLPDGAWSEEGIGTGITVAFDIYDNGGGEAPAIDIKYGGATLASMKFPIGVLRTGTNFWDVTIRVKPNGTLDVVYNTNVVYTNFSLPNFSAISGARFGFGARTGGLNENQWIDDLQITTTQALGITREPQDLTVVPGKQVTYTTSVSDPAGVTYQWSSNNVAVAGATNETFGTPPLALAQSGLKVKVQASRTGTNVPSREATVSVVAISPPASPKATFDFNSGAVPANTAIFGTATVTATGGVGNSGVLRLTEALNDQNGSFIIQDLDGGTAVDSFTAAFKAR